LTSGTQSPDIQTPGWRDVASVRPAACARATRRRPGRGRAVAATNQSENGGASCRNDLNPSALL
jgi:hypothetical protein